MDSKELPSRKYTVHVHTNEEGTDIIAGKWSKHKYDPQKGK